LKSKALLAMALVLVMAAAFTTIGMAYTASTDNSGNTATSEYIVLEQTNYTFSSNSGLRFDIITTKTGTVYQTNGTFTIGIPNGELVNQYVGVQIGQSDTLKATEINTSLGTIPVSVNTFAPGSNTGFQDFSANTLGWRYVLEVVGPDPNNPGNTLTQYAVYDGATPSQSDLVEWRCFYVDANEHLVPTQDNCLSIKSYSSNTDVYTTKLYFVGPKVGETSMAESPLRPDSQGMIINDGTIKFIYESSGGNPE